MNFPPWMIIFAVPLPFWDSNFFALCLPSQIFAQLLGCICLGGDLRLVQEGKFYASRSMSFSGRQIDDDDQNSSRLTSKHFMNNLGSCRECKAETFSSAFLARQQISFSYTWTQFHFPRALSHPKPISDKFLRSFACCCEKPILC